MGPAPTSTDERADNPNVRSKLALVSLSALPLLYPLAHLLCPIPHLARPHKIHPKQMTLSQVKGPQESPLDLCFKGLISIIVRKPFLTMKTYVREMASLSDSPIFPLGSLSPSFQSMGPWATLPHWIRGYHCLQGHVIEPWEDSPSRQEGEAKNMVPGGRMPICTALPLLPSSPTSTESQPQKFRKEVSSAFTTS